MFDLENIKFKNILNISSLKIPEAKISCIIGESGSGKTTILKLLNHMISPDSGMVLYKGRDVLQWNPVDLRREVVMLPQNPITFAGDIRENLLIGLEFSEKPKKSNEELEAALKLVNLDKSLDISAEKLSGGEKQRLSLARVILMEPEVLLLDEPSSALDEETANLVIERVVDYVRKYNKTLVMVTHSRMIANKHADNLVIVSKGQIESEVSR